VAELIEEYQTHCVTERQYRPRTAHVEHRRLSGIFLQKADMRLSRLTRAKAEALTQALWLRGNRKSGAERLAVATNRYDGRLLGRFGEWACKAKYIPENPFVGLMPTGKANVGKVHLTTDERVKWVRACEDAMARGSELALAALFCLYRGTRAAEIMQRCVRDVDDLGRKLIISGAKTQAGNRRLSIPEALRGHFAALCAGKLPTEPLFAQDRPGPKKPRSTTSLHRAVQRICKTAGVTLICTHSLRGMNAELQLEGGIAEDVVAKSLGHTSIRITKSHYVSRDTQDAIAAKKADIAMSKYSDHNLLPAQSVDAESVLAQFGPEVAAALRTLLATARAAA
jgi:integrase